MVISRGRGWKTSNVTRALGPLVLLSTVHWESGTDSLSCLAWPRIRMRIRRTVDGPSGAYMVEMILRRGLVFRAKGHYLLVMLVLVAPALGASAGIRRRNFGNSTLYCVSVPDSPECTKLLQCRPVTTTAPHESDIHFLPYHCHAPF